MKPFHGEFGDLWHNRAAALACVGVSLAVTLLVFHGLSGSQAAHATAEVLVDGPTSLAVDLSQPTYGLKGQTSRAELLGALLASSRVMTQIAKQVSLPGGVIVARSTALPSSTRVRVRVGGARYQLNADVNATTPILLITGHAAQSADAVRLVEASIATLRWYVRTVHRSQRTPRTRRIGLQQLGPTAGSSGSNGANMLELTLVFLGMLALSIAALRVRRVVRNAPAEPEPVAPAFADRPQTPTPPEPRGEHR